MKRIIDYFKNNRYALLSFYFLIYVIGFFIIERLPMPEYWVSYIPLDDKIPFCRYFIYPYCMWYPFLAVCGLYLLIKKEEQPFRDYMWFIIIGFTGTLLFCILFPNGQDLRATDLGNSITDRLVKWIYTADTNTNVIPSMHIIGTIAGIFAMFRAKSQKGKLFKYVLLVIGIAIMLATVFVKQHSALDVIISLIVCVPLYLLTFGGGLRKIKACFKKKKKQEK